MRVFISQPMSGISQEEIEKRREKIIEMIEDRYLNEDIEFIYSIVKEKPNDNVRYEPVWYLGNSIQLLSTATIVYFDKNWQTARGCRIERDICEFYKIPTIDYTDFVLNY